MNSNNGETSGTDVRVSEPQPAGRRRFLGHMSKLAPAAIVTLNSSAALAQAKSSLTAAAGPTGFTFDPDTDKLNTRKKRAAVTAEREGFALDGPLPGDVASAKNADVPNPLCIDAPLVGGEVGDTMPGDRIDLSNGYRIRGFQKDDKGGVCRRGAVLVSVSSFNSFDPLTKGLG